MRIVSSQPPPVKDCQFFPLCFQNPIVASYGGGSDSEEEQDQNGSSNADAEQPLTDWTKLICLLCKRQFPSREVLVKHQQFSDLHKQNLEAMRARISQDNEVSW